MYYQISYKTQFVFLYNHNHQTLVDHKSVNFAHFLYHFVPNNFPWLWARRKSYNQWLNYQTKQWTKQWTLSKVRREFWRLITIRHRNHYNAIWLITLNQSHFLQTDSFGQNNFTIWAKQLYHLSKTTLPFEQNNSTIWAKQLYQYQPLQVIDFLCKLPFRVLLPTSDERFPGSVLWGVWRKGLVDQDLQSLASPSLILTGFRHRPQLGYMVLQEQCHKSQLDPHKKSESRMTASVLKQEFKYINDQKEC